MMQKDFCQLSRYMYIYTRRIQFTLQGLHVVGLSFSDNDDVTCCFIGRSKDIFTVQFINFSFQRLY